MEKPKLRWPIDFQVLPELQAIVLRCPHGLTDEPLVLRQELHPVLALLDGSRTVEAMVEQYASNGLTLELMENLLALLDSKFFLESALFHERREEIFTKFREMPIRPAALAGSAYNADPSILAHEIQAFFPSGMPERPLHGLVAPHIDYRRGGSGYGLAYAGLGSEHDVLVILGTSHQYGRRKFILSEKDFATPLGILENARSLTREIAARFGLERSYDEEMRHRTEHSLELQLPFLQCRSSKAKIIPLLVGSFHEAIERNRYPDEEADYQDFLGHFSEVLKEARGRGVRVGFIAGVDMAHVGKQFGDRFELTDEVLGRVRERDDEYLKLFVGKDRHGLHDHIAEDNDARRICGYPSLYTLLDIMERLKISYRASLLGYQQAVDTHKTCGVTFASLHLESSI